MPDLSTNDKMNTLLNNSKKLTPVEVKQFRKIIRNSSFNETLEKINEAIASVKTLRKENQTKIFMLNTLTIVDVFVSKEIVILDENEVQVQGIGSGNWSKMEFTKFKKGITQLWSEVMKWNKSQKVHEKILRLLPDRIMKCLTNPLHTSDYLVSAFDFGGPLALHSLRGIFVLMTKYHMEVPDFYTRLYSLLSPNILDDKYRSEFFITLDIFLTSSHLPEKLVAAFVKKLARMTLLAPSPTIILICAFIQNLMIRHPGLVIMVDAKTSKTVSKDPFLPNEADPMNSNAMESSLWEIKTMQCHGLESVTNAAKFIDKPFGKQEIPWTDYLKYDYLKLFEMEASSAENISETIRATLAVMEGSRLSGSLCKRVLGNIFTELEMSDEDDDTETGDDGEGEEMVE